MPKYLSEKAQRIATYVQDKKEVSKWDPIVKKNRKVKRCYFNFFLKFKNQNLLFKE